MCMLHVDDNGLLTLPSGGGGGKSSVSMFAPLLLNKPLGESTTAAHIPKGGNKENVKKSKTDMLPNNISNAI